MTEFEDACHEVLAKLHTHEVEGTQQALDELVRAQVRRSSVLTDMMNLLDILDDGGKRR